MVVGDTYANSAQLVYLKLEFLFLDAGIPIKKVPIEIGNVIVAVESAATSTKPHCSYQPII